MAEILPLSKALARFVHDGDSVAMEGFTHLIPFAAGHDLRADREGNVLIEGIVGVQKETVTGVEKGRGNSGRGVDELKPESTNSIVLPAWRISAVSVAPRGARPSYTHGYYDRDNAFYIQWDAISRERETFPACMLANVDAG